MEINKEEYEQLKDIKKTASELCALIDKWQDAMPHDAEQIMDEIVAVKDELQTNLE